MGSSEIGYHVLANRINILLRSSCDCAYCYHFLLRTIFFRKIRTMHLHFQSYSPLPISTRARRSFILKVLRTEFVVPDANLRANFYLIVLQNSRKLVNRNQNQKFPIWFIPSKSPLWRRWENNKPSYYIAGTTRAHDEENPVFGLVARARLPALIPSKKNLFVTT